MLAREKNVVGDVSCRPRCPIDGIVGPLGVSPVVRAEIRPRQKRCRQLGNKSGGLPVTWQHEGAQDAARIGCGELWTRRVSGTVTVAHAHTQNSLSGAPVRWTISSIIGDARSFAAASDNKNIIVFVTVYCLCIRPSYSLLAKMNIILFPCSSSRWKYY